MSDVFHAPPQAATQRAPEYTRAEEGSGWVAFAGTMILIVGVLNVIYGIAAIDGSSFYIEDARYVLSDLSTLGWLVLIVGVVQVCAALGIWRGGQIGRWIGVLSACANAILQLIFIASYPLLSLALFGVNVLVIYGLIAHGGRRSA